MKATAAYGRYGEHYARLSKLNELYISIEMKHNADSLKLALYLKNMHRIGMAVITFREYEKEASAEHKERFMNILLSMNHNLHGSFLVQYYRSVVSE
ncbi:hypothetical protein J6TS7_43380 [Paenibacillus dendritiformis]|nr:hypothetical protein J6TS7_43380 [Paenibacillus dendritiformis]